MEIPQGYNLKSPEGFIPQKRSPSVQAMIDGTRHIVIPGNEHPIRQAILDGASKVELKKDTNILLSYWALLFPMRQYVISKIKDPLRKSIENAKTLGDITQELFSAIKKIPLITKKNTCFLNTHILIDKGELLLKYHLNPSRQKLCKGAFDMFIFEYEHDGYYAFLLDWVIIELAMELARGKWKPRFTKFPLKDCWAGPNLPDIETIRKNLRDALNERTESG